MRRKFKQRLIALVLFMTFIAVTYICVNNLDDPNRLYWKKSEKKSTDYDSNFTPFCDRNKPDWLRMIRSALKTLDYFEDNLDELVTDAAVGTRIMEAQLNILLKSGPNLSPEILRDLKELHRKSKLVGDTIVERYMEYIELNGVEQNARMKKNLNWIISSSTWETPSPRQWKTLITNNGRIDTADGIDMNVTFGSSSDGCIFGTFENCEIPNYCIDFMWRKPLSGYLLTHQILFHYMIGRNDCFSGKRRILYESQNLVQPKSFLETMCRRVITETKLIESRHYPYTHQDLFVEQILVCSLAGYNDFLTSKWTNVLLEWSAENELLGCYTTTGLKKFDKIGSKKRVKRWDSIIHVNDKLCSVHMGALILGVVGQQLRYFLEMCYDL